MSEARCVRTRFRTAAAQLLLALVPRQMGAGKKGMLQSKSRIATGKRGQG